MRILILDDQYERDPSTQELFRWRLRKQVDATTYAGILLDFCADSSDALRHYREYGPFDLIITAFGQRGMGWNAFIQAMRKENPNQAILLYTAVADARNLLSLEEEYKRWQVTLGSKIDSNEGALWRLIQKAIANSPRSSAEMLASESLCQRC